jgi:hypothetical protein
MCEISPLWSVVLATVRIGRHVHVMLDCGVAAVSGSVSCPSQSRTQCHRSCPRHRQYHELWSALGRPAGYSRDPDWSCKKKIHHNNLLLYNEKSNEHR